MRASYVFIYPGGSGAVLAADGVPLLTWQNDPRGKQPGWILSHAGELPQRRADDRFIGGGHGDFEWVLDQVRRQLQRLAAEQTRPPVAGEPISPPATEAA